jgi:hypothetical protein
VRTGALLLGILAAGCSTRRVSPDPLLPPSVYSSPGGTLAAAGGVVAASVGAELTDRDRSMRSRRIGNAAMGAGAALLGAALVDAIETDRARRDYVNLYNAFIRSYSGSPPPFEPAHRPAPAPPPVLPQIDEVFLPPSAGFDP